MFAATLVRQLPDRLLGYGPDKYNAIALQAVATAKKYLDESAADTKKLQTVTVCPLS